MSDAYLIEIAEQQLRRHGSNMEYNEIRNSTAVRIENYIQMHKEIKETAMTPEEAQLIAKLVAEQIKHDDVFSNNMMWELHSRIEYNRIADELAHRFNTSDIVEKLLEEETYASRNFVARILHSDTFGQRLRTSIHPIVSEWVNGEDVKQQIEEQVERKSTNMANEIVSRVMRLISRRITEASDV
ncbi:MAG: hypothetical protein EBU84_10580 [Actinobacteria bacterium]|nr:hypothetical protein [Actinomycetota bacterium]